jgi:uncharacterized membrane protein
MKLEHSVVINLPLSEVFSFAGDLENDGQWIAGRVEAQRSGSNPTSAGSRFTQVNKFLGRRIESTVEVTEYEPNHKVRSKSISGPVTFTEYRLFEPAGGGTRLTIVLEAETTGGLFKLADPIVTRMASRQMQGDLANLKDLLESQAPAVV